MKFDSWWGGQLIWQSSQLGKTSTLLVPLGTEDLLLPAAVCSVSIEVGSLQCWGRLSAVWERWGSLQSWGKLNAVWERWGHCSPGEGCAVWERWGHCSSVEGWKQCERGGVTAVLGKAAVWERWSDCSPGEGWMQCERGGVTAVPGKAECSAKRGGVTAVLGRAECNAERGGVTAVLGKAYCNAERWGHCSPGEGQVQCWERLGVFGLSAPSLPTPTCGHQPSCCSVIPFSIVAVLLQCDST